MARFYNSTNTQLSSSSLASRVSGATTATMAGWIYRAAAGTRQFVGSNETTNTLFGMEWFSDNNIYFETSNGLNYAVAAYNFTGWHHLCLSYNGGEAVANNRVKCYANGNPLTLTYVGTQATALPVISAFRVNRMTSSNYWGVGGYADFGIWNVALSQQEAASLASGVRPVSLRANNLTGYVPLNDQWTYDGVSGLFLTEGGGSFEIEDPPPIRKPRGRYFLFGETAAPASVIFRNRTGSRARLIA